MKIINLSFSYLEKFLQKYFWYVFSFIWLLFFILTIKNLSLGLFYYKGSAGVFYEYYIHLVNYVDFGFTKRAIFNTIFKLLNFNLSYYNHYVFIRLFLIFILVSLIFYWFYNLIQNTKYKIQNTKYKIIN